MMETHSFPIRHPELVSESIGRFVRSKRGQADARGEDDGLNDLVRDLLRRDQETAEEEAEWLRGLIAEGLASGISEEKPETIIDNIIATRRARRG